MLNSETDTPMMERRVRRAFAAFIAANFGRKAKNRDIFFEHGHWWARTDWKDETLTYAVVDAALESLTATQIVQGVRKTHAPSRGIFYGFAFED